MRITLCVNKDLVGCYALNHFMQKMAAKHQITVVLSDRIMQAKDTPNAYLDELQLLERDLFVEQLMPLMDATQSAPANTASPALRTFQGIAAHYDVPLQEIRAINSPAGVEAFAKTEPDVILSIRYGYVFKEAILTTARRHVLNVHSGILPHYRGVMPTFRTMLAGDTQAGITLHTIDDAGIDTGRVLGIRTLPITKARSMLWHVISLYPLAAEMADAALDQLEATGQLPKAITQNEADANYFSFPSEADIQQFFDKGFRLFDRGEYLSWLDQFHAQERQQAVA